jgi:hypothetical protein
VQAPPGLQVPVVPPVGPPVLPPAVLVALPELLVVPPPSPVEPPPLEAPALPVLAAEVVLALLEVEGAAEDAPLPDELAPEPVVWPPLVPVTPALDEPAAPPLVLEAAVTVEPALPLPVDAAVDEVELELAPELLEPLPVEVAAGPFPGP